MVGELISNDFVRILWGNKIDLSDKRKISFEEGLKKATEHSMFFFETSATEGTNIDKLFELAAAEIKKKISDGKVTRAAEIVKTQDTKTNKKSWY